MLFTTTTLSSFDTTYKQAACIVDMRRACTVCLPSSRND